MQGYDRMIDIRDASELNEITGRQSVQDKFISKMT